MYKNNKLQAFLNHLFIPPIKLCINIIHDIDVTVRLITANLRVQVFRLTTTTRYSLFIRFDRQLLRNELRSSEKVYLQPGRWDSGNSVIEWIGNGARVRETVRLVGLGQQRRGAEGRSTAPCMGQLATSRGTRAIYIPGDLWVPGATAVRSNYTLHNIGMARCQCCPLSGDERAVAPRGFRAIRAHATSSFRQKHRDSISIGVSLFELCTDTSSRVSTMYASLNVLVVGSLRNGYGLYRCDFSTWHIACFKEIYFL